MPRAPYPRPRAHSLSSRAGAGALGPSAAQGAAQAKSGGSALPRLLRGATQAAHWPLFIAHSFDWVALRGGAAALSATLCPRSPPTPPQAAHPDYPLAGTPHSLPNPTSLPPRIPKPEPQALGHSGFPHTHACLRAGNRGRRACRHLRTLGLVCTPAPAFPPPASPRGGRRDRPGGSRPGLPRQVPPPPAAQHPPPPRQPSPAQSELAASRRPSSRCPQASPRRSWCRAKARQRRSLAAAQPGGTLGAVTLGKSPGFGVI